MDARNTVVVDTIIAWFAQSLPSSRAPPQKLREP